VALPLLYGIGTGLPVFGFALLILLGFKNIGRLFHAVTKAEYWLRRITALVLMMVGIYYTCVYIFNIQVFS
jgi:cytochrome c-type biogenesis protein